MARRAHHKPRKTGELEFDRILSNRAPMIKAIIFDVDGVLLDSFEANLGFFQNLMEMAGYQPPTKNEYVPLFHRTLHDVVQILTRIDDEKETKRVCDLIDVVETPPSVITKGAPEVVEELSKKYFLGVATSRIRTRVYKPPLGSLESFFKATVVYEDTKNHKPHPDPLLLTASQLGIRPEECVYVGDGESDLIAARAAGMKFVLYAEEKINGVDANTSDFREITELIETL